MAFSDISKSLRKEKGISQVQLAEALQVSKACISMIEIGKNEPTANTLVRYADFFECSTDYLLEREDDFGNITVQPKKTALLPNNEQALLDNFRKLPVDLQHRASVYMQKLVEVIADERQTAFPAQKNTKSKRILNK